MIVTLGALSMVLIANIAAYWYACRYERRPASAPESGPARTLLRIFLCMWRIWALLVARWFSY
jgi:hypothetical protein